MSHPNTYTPSRKMRAVTLRTLAFLLFFLVLHLMYTIAYPRLRRSGYFGGKTVWLGNNRQMLAEHDGSATNSSSRPRATFVVLARNSDLHSLRPSIRAMEDRFNRHHHYDWVFLNEAEFSEEFIELTSALTKAKTKYGLIPKEHWSYPDWIDVAKADAGRSKMEQAKVIYGGSLPYRHMCRFNSGFFFQHPLLAEYQYYWRVEPSVEFHCDITEDPFEFMHRTGKKYGFTLSLYEYEATIPTLWNTVKDFIAAHPEHIPKNNAMKFVSDNDGQSYNLCHFWSNFEIASLDFWRSKAYMDFFNFLDKKGGFFYERWGDAPVHSIAAALFLRKDEIHFFNNIGYKHNPFLHCPAEKELQRQCHCNPADSFDYNGYSCLRKFESLG